MRFLKRWTKRIRAFTSGARADEEMNEEFALHLELETAKNIPEIRRIREDREVP
jgi:hypothetical protein